jgi:hypothetical protein
MGDKLHVVRGTDGVDHGRAFRCPGCRDTHRIPVAGPKRWTFNESMVAPTFWPSILVRYEGEDDGKRVVEICHSFVTDGRIEFLKDCTHALNGQTVELPDWERKAAQ